jgi:histone H3/H4
MTEEKVSLPKATIAKLIKEILPEDIKCAQETRDLILECCIEFIHLITAEANEHCARDNKKVLTAEYVLRALETLGFENYAKEVKATYNKLKSESMEKLKTEPKRPTLSESELLKLQQDLFAKSRSAVRSQQINLGTSVFASSPFTTTKNDKDSGDNDSNNTIPSSNNNVNNNSEDTTFQRRCSEEIFINEGISRCTKKRLFEIVSLCSVLG